MDDGQRLELPARLTAIEGDTKAMGFAMASARETGSLLRTLAGAKPGGRFLELGTGTGLATCWILDGMDRASTLATVDHDEAVLAVARKHLAHDARLSTHLADGAEFLASLAERRFDFIFADAWPGKFHHLDEALSLLAPGALYVADDLLPQPGWPEDHAPRIPKWIRTMEARVDLRVTRLSWSTGILIATKKPEGGAAGAREEPPQEGSSQRTRS